MLEEQVYRNDALQHVRITLREMARQQYKKKYPSHTMLITNPEKK